MDNQNITSYSPLTDKIDNKTKLKEEYILLYNKFHINRTMTFNSTQPVQIKCFKFELRILWEMYIGKNIRISAKDMNTLNNLLTKIKTDWNHITKLNDLNNNCIDEHHSIDMYDIYYNLFQEYKQQLHKSISE
jgi:hypothetical protein